MMKLMMKQIIKIIMMTHPALDIIVQSNTP